MEGLRDWVVIITGIVWSLVFFSIFLVVAFVGHLVDGYLNKAHRLMRRTVMPMMARVQAQAEIVRLKTAGLPGQPAPPGVIVVSTTSRPSRSLPKIPFLHRKRPWWQRILPR